MIKKLLLLLAAGCMTLFGQNVVFNELMTKSTFYVDEDGDYSDWIEIYNKQDAPIDLTGYSLSDDQGELFKWVMPQIILQPKKHLLIFASDKNRKNIMTWESVITWGDYWKYFPGTSEPPASWKTLSFNDTSWQSGKSGFGNGDNDDSTVVPLLQSLYARKTFTIENINSVQSAILHVDYDDGFVAYLNGVEIARSNIGTAGVVPLFNASATSAREALIYQGGKPDSINLNNYLSLFIQGENVLAIQVHNYGTNSTDMSLIPFLSLGLTTTPVLHRKVNPLLNLHDRYLHTNFKLSSEGESLFLTNPQGFVEEQISFGYIPSDISYGRKPDGDSAWFYFSECTPGDSNSGSGYTGIAGEPVFSLPAGFYQQPVNVYLTPSVPTNIIRYTLDGSDPADTSSQYIGAVSITASKVLRAKEFNLNFIPGKIVTNTYLINVPSELPVISLSTNPGNFFDNDYGIYVLGDSADPNEPHFGANYWMDWERPVHVELFDTNGSGFSMDAGVKIFGKWSRAFDQKSLAIYARKEYGYSEINYKLFNDLPITKFESFVLRNSGNDWQQTLIRDALSSRLLDGSGIDKQAYRPVVVFLNGSYWGIHDLREKLNEDYFASHYNIDKDSVEIVEPMKNLVGLNADYQGLYNFISSNNLALSTNYEYVKTKMDVENFTSYFVSQIYIDNTDWPGNNLKIWRGSASGKWRWILYDTDFGYGLYDQYGFQHNTLTFATATNGPEWPNPAWSTLFLRKLLENITFRNNFINRYADYRNTRFTYQNAYSKITELKSAITSEIPRHATRWNQFDQTQWNYNVQRIFDFANQRLTYMDLHFIQKFSLPGMKSVNIYVTDTSMGYINLNSLTLTTLSWKGAYFMNVPLKIIAVPKRGYRFVRWEGTVTGTEDSLTVTLTDHLNAIAVFQIDNPTGINTQEQVPVSFSLAQNYPNPFNPVTTIKFSIPMASKVIIKLYNVLGREIKSIVNKEYNSGTYEVEFNAEHLSSGVYFYRITAGSYSAVKKMQIIK